MRANDPYLVGLTGGIASGKTTVSRMLAMQGVCVIDADEISRALTAPGGEALEPIREAFGHGVFAGDGALDRAKLAAIVFEDEGERRRLERILHPMVQKHAVDLIQAQGEMGAALCVLSAPLLFETGMDALCDEVWVVTLEPETQLMRLMQRDHMPREDAQARIDAQLSKQERERRADVLIKNDRAEADLEREVSRQLAELLARLESKPKG